MILPKEINLTKMKLFFREIKQARSYFMVVVSYSLLCFFPVTINIPIFSSVSKFEGSTITIWVISACILNSSVNSVIFFWTKTMLRKEALNLLKAGCEY